MALKGTLRDFSIADIFQLLSQQGKTGMLTIATPEEEVQVALDRGNVVLARFTKGNEELKLGNLMYRAGIISRNQLEIALNEHKRVMTNLGEILLSRKYVNEATFSEFMALQTREVMFHVLQWRSGAYKFVSGDFTYNKKIIQPLSTDFLLMDGVRQLDEWPGIIENLPSFHTIYDASEEGKTILKELGVDENAGDEDIDDLDAAFAEFDDAPAKKSKKNKKDKLEESEQTVLKLINGSRPLQDVIDKSRLGKFETCKSVVELLKRNLVYQLQGAAGPTVVRQKKPFLGGFQYKRLLSKVFISTAACATLAALILFTRPIIIGETSTIDRKQVRPSSLVESYIVNTTIERLRSAISAYHIENSEYPRNLVELYKNKLLSKKDLARIKKQEFYYTYTAESFTVLLPPY